ncbi:MAG: ThiF family adenylyltransferase [Planctomycetes bacterium]|nr:ThiF family adenylyltransferase [Planctomycetota bacterium]
MSETDPRLARYARQMAVESLGTSGQQRLRHACVTLIGCGALGSASADMLVRAGVGRVQIIDRDVIELHNLQRQTLFDEHDVAHDLPKAVAAANRLRKINSSVEVNAVVGHVDAGNAEELCEQADLILDCTDNFETRFLINDVAVKLGMPWIYAACAAAEGMVMPVLPQATPCLRCIWPDVPTAAMSATSETAGALGPTACTVASVQSVEALKILAGRLDDVVRKLITVDVWRHQIRAVDMQTAFGAGGCRCCGQGEYDFLGRQPEPLAVVSCGQATLQVVPEAGTSIDLKRVAERIRGQGRPRVTQHVLTVVIEGYGVTLFGDGRAIFRGLADTSVAQRLYAEHFGS